MMCSLRAKMQEAAVLSLARACLHLRPLPSADPEICLYDGACLA